MSRKVSANFVALSEFFLGFDTLIIEEVWQEPASSILFFLVFDLSPSEIRFSPHCQAGHIEILHDCAIVVLRHTP